MIVLLITFVLCIVLYEFRLDKTLLNLTTKTETSSEAQEYVKERDDLFDIFTELVVLEQAIKVNSKLSIDFKKFLTITVERLWTLYFQIYDMAVEEHKNFLPSLRSLINSVNTLNENPQTVLLSLYASDKHNTLQSIAISIDKLIIAAKEVPKRPPILLEMDKSQEPVPQLDLKSEVLVESLENNSKELLDLYALTQNKETKKSIEDQLELIHSHKKELIEGTTEAEVALKVNANQRYLDGFKNNWNIE